MYYQKMQTLIQPNLKRRKVSFDNSTLKVKEKFNNSKLGLNCKFYQKVFPLLIASFTFLIFPESPKTSAVLCQKYYSTKACIIW